MIHSKNFNMSAKNGKHINSLLTERCTYGTITANEFCGHWSLSCTSQAALVFSMTGCV